MDISNYASLPTAKFNVGKNWKSSQILFLGDLTKATAEGQGGLPSIVQIQCT